MGKTPDNVYWVNRRAAADQMAVIAGLGKTRRNSRTSPRRRGIQAPVKQVTLAYMLQQTGRKMEPFYRRVATDESYARRFCEALAESDLEKIEQMLKEASPKIGHTYPGTSGIGILWVCPSASRSRSIPTGPRCLRVQRSSPSSRRPSSG